MAKPNGKRDQTRKRILDAAAKEFISRGFEGVTISQVARRAHLSKQLVYHHFSNKETLFALVHESRFRPLANWEDEIPRTLKDIIAVRFKRRAQNLDYMRVLTWEAASIRDGVLPGEKERTQRISRYAMGLRLLQAEGRLPRNMDFKMLHLTILALASYPLCFSELTRLVTGKSGTDPRFQRDWVKHLKILAAQLLTVERKIRK